MALLSPAEHVIRTIGGVRKTARAIGRQPSSISAWRNAKGTNGKVPRNAQRSILTYARAKNLDITADDLIFGRLVPSTKKKRAS